MEGNKMQYVNLGRSALKVSRLCLGTMNYGSVTSEQDSYAIMDRALDLGINFFDTADVYGSLGVTENGGTTEKIIGRWFAQGGGRREKVVIATKVYGWMGDWPNNARLSKLHIRRALDASLKRLQTDYIDLYQMHHIWREAGWDEIWEALELAHQQGKVVYLGSSNFAGWNIAQASAEAKKRNLLGLVSEQCHYNLMARKVELELLPACEHYGLGVVAYSPLFAGLLGGALDKEKKGHLPAERVRERFEKSRSAIERYEALCRDLGENPADVGLAWVLRNPVITAPIVGARNLDQLEKAMRSLQVVLNDEVLKRLDDIFPGPGGQAPEAWAW
jgi:aryl-alcohol dehydrogenase-like predicted oxidoreductase